MTKINDFTDLIAWQVAHELVLNIYRLTNEFPNEEKFGLTDQIKRAAISVTSNIAEGFARKSVNEKIHFYFISQGSLTEIQNQIYIARDVKYITNKQSLELIDKTKRVQMLINGMIKSLKMKVQVA